VQPDEEPTKEALDAVYDLLTKQHQEVTAEHIVIPEPEPEEHEVKESELWDELHGALKDAGQIIDHQKQIIDGLGTPPNSFGTILAIEPPTAHTAENVLERKVRVGKGEPHAERFGVIAEAEEITNEEGTWIEVFVRFDNAPNTGAKYVLEQLEFSDGNLDSGSILIDNGKDMVKQPYPFWIREEFKVGDIMLIDTRSGAPVGVADEVPDAGEICNVRNVISDRLAEIETNGGTRVVFGGRYAGTLKVGDRVVINPSGVVIVKNLGRGENRWNLESATDTTWGDIGGLEKAKEVMREAVELPLKFKELYAQYGKKPIKGVLLYGPPGCGKTMLGKAAASSISEIHEGESGAFMYIKGPALLNKWVGETESQIRSIFAAARQYKQEKGLAPVIFIDEADAILSKRGSGRSSDMEKTMVPMFLAEMDGLDDAAALVILATNRSDKLDSAVVRDGRVDRKIKVTRPTQVSAAQIFELNMQNVPLKNGHSVEDLATFAAKQVFAKKRGLYEIRAKDGSEHKVCLSHAVNGGMIVGVVDQATTLAIARDMKKGTATGITKADLTAAIDNVYFQNANLDHNELLVEFAEDNNIAIEAVRPVLRGGEGQ